MKICASIDRSAGNETVGDMWTETAEFDETIPLSEVLAWASGRIGYDFHAHVDMARGLNVRLSVLQNPKESDAWTMKR